MKIDSISSNYSLECKKPCFSGIQAAGRPIVEVLNELENIHLDDKVSILLKKLSKGDYLIVSPNKESAQSQLRSLAALTGSLKGAVYHVQNDKFSDVLTFGYNQTSGKLQFINLNDQTVKMNTIPVNSYYGVDIKDGDRVWSSNMRSVLIKSKPDVSPELENKYSLLADQYDRYELLNLSSEVNKRPLTTNHIH